MKSAKRSLAVLLAALLLCSATAFTAGNARNISDMFWANLASADSEGAKQETAQQEKGPAKAEQPATRQENQAQPKAAKSAELRQSASCDCGKCPTIVVHGIGQSNTWLYENGEKKLDANGEPISGWGIGNDLGGEIPKLILPLVSSLVSQSDKGLSKAIYNIGAGLLGVNKMNEQGGTIADVRTETYLKPYSEFSEQELEDTLGRIPMQELAQQIGMDHMYYFAYNSFGNNLAIAQELYDFVQLVKEQTGHAKVNILPISLGGTIMNSLLEFYQDDGIFNDLNTVVYIVPALDGSCLIGDVYNGRLNTGDESLYRTLFPALMDDYTGYLMNVVIRLLPKSVVLKVFDSLIAGVTDASLRGCTNLWALVPGADYPEARERLLGDERYAEIRRQTDLYHTAQRNSRANILAMQAAGVKVYDIADYNIPLLPLVPSSAEHNGDGIIHLASTSMGANAGFINTPLGEAYTQQACTAHNHISPDGIVDASTGALPDYTFYFANQDHERTGSNDVIMKLATALCLEESYQTVFDLSAFPQFNEGRDTKGLRNSLLPKALAVDTATLSAQDAQELSGAITECQEMIANTTAEPAAVKHAIDRLNAILAKIEGRAPAKANSGEALLNILCKLLSDALYQYLGPRGFSDIRR